MPATASATPITSHGRASRLSPPRCSQATNKKGPPAPVSSPQAERLTVSLVAIANAINPSGRIRSGPREIAPSASPKPTSAQTQNQAQPTRCSLRARSAVITTNDLTTREATMRAAAPWPSG